MELLVAWLATVIGSFTIGILNEMRIFKDVADCGYILDVEKLSDFQNHINPDGNKTYLLSLLIPGVNIATVFKKATQYNNARPMILSQLSALNSLIHMTKEEEALYQSNPTALNAALLTIKAGVKYMDDIKTINFGVENEKYSISYKNGRNNKRIITKVKGPISKLSITEQQDKIDEMLTKLAKVFSTLPEEKLRDLIDKSLDEDGDLIIELSDLFMEERHLQSNDIDEVSISSKIEQLKQLKNSAIEATQEQQTEEQGHSNVLKP